MKLGYVVADILIAVIAEGGQFSLIGADNDSVSSDPMYGNGSILDEIVQLLLAASQRFLCVLKCGDLFL